MQRFFDHISSFGQSTALISTHEGREVSYLELGRLVDQKITALPKERCLTFIEAGNTTSSIVNYLAALVAGHPAHLMESFESENGQALIERYSPNLLLREEEIRINSNEAADLHPDLAILLSTSGSTGSPKFVKLSHRNLQANTSSIREYLRLSPTDRAFCHLKPYYSFGMSIINSHLDCGASIILSNHSMIDDEFWQDMATKQATSFSGVPYNYETLLRRGFDPNDYPSLRYATQAGGKLDADLVRHFAELFAETGKEFYVMYGQTEASPRMSYLPPELARDYPNSIGKAVPGGHLFIVDETGQEIRGIGREGELAYEGPNVMMGYAQHRTELGTDETPARLVTGDIARRLTADLFQIVGRSSRFVKPFGARIGLDDVQSFVKLTHAVSAVTGTDNEIVIGLEGRENKALRDDIVRKCSNKYALPRQIFNVKFFDELPLLPTGKVDYRAVLDARMEIVPSSSLRKFREIVLDALGFRDERAETVLDAFRNVLQKPSITPDQSFEEIGADSLSYVSLSLELEHVLGSQMLEHWTSIPIRDLESRREMFELKSA